jgi:hypothetical protein
MEDDEVFYLDDYLVFNRKTLELINSLFILKKEKE